MKNFGQTIVPLMSLSPTYPKTFITFSPRGAGFSVSFFRQPQFAVCRILLFGFFILASLLGNQFTPDVQLSMGLSCTLCAKAEYAKRTMNVTNNKLFILPSQIFVPRIGVR